MSHELSNADRAKLDALYEGFVRDRRTFIGYPCNTQFDYRELYRFLEFSINNIGDPFGSSHLKMNTFGIEREMLAEFAKLTHAPADDYWGYINNGGTEGNMYGLYLARELHPDSMVYFSEDTHYSVAKIMRVLNTRNIMIKAQPNGEMDYDDLRETLRIHRDVPPIIFANIGTTMKGAIDNLDIIRGILDDLAIRNAYIHCDAALSGMILPFVDDAQPFDFADGADSLSISGHKLIGSPIPCGVVLAKKKNVDRIARSVEYVGALDTTLSGSRNAISPLILWYAFRRLGHEGFREIVAESLRLADYAIEAFGKRGIKTWRGRNSITVVTPRPPRRVLEKWQIAPYRDIGHLVTLPHVSEDVIDEVANDYARHDPDQLATPITSAKKTGETP